MDIMSDGFEKYLFGLTDATPGVNYVQELQQHVRTALERTEIRFNDLQPIGSFAKHLMLGGPSVAVVDMLCSVEPGVLSSNGPDLLAQVDSSLELSADVRFLFREVGLRANVVFGCRRSHASLWSILHPQDGSWIDTDPLRHIQILLDEDEKHEHRLTTLVLMLKAWNRGIGFAFTSFYLERLATMVFGGDGIGNYGEALKWFFEAAYQLVTDRLDDPCNPNNAIDPLDCAKEIAVGAELFNRARQRADVALEYATVGRLDCAIGEWRRLLGSDFARPDAQSDSDLIA